MIIICEPNCQHHSHETFNLGFIHGVRKAWPDDEILVLADESHGRVLLNNANFFPVDLCNVSFRFIRTYVHADFINVIWNFFLIWKVIRLAREKNARAVMFLSANQMQQRIIKHFGKQVKELVLTMNMAGEIDRLAYPDFHITEVEYPRGDSFLQRLWKRKKQLPKLIVQHIGQQLKKIWDEVGNLTFPTFDLRDTLLKGNTENIRYICLSDHISKGLPKYIDTSKINLRTIILPAVFHSTISVPNNSILKVATFGYGHNALLYKLNCELMKQQIDNEYEIRVIGMDGRGTDEFSHTTWPLQHVLTRQEMETLAQDIDMFLILYEKERYVLSCSGSIIEAHQYGKPILYLRNPCMDAFNPIQAPIGIACNDIEDMAHVLARLINDYQAFKPQLLQFRENIMNQRLKIDINNNLDRMRKILI